MAKAEKTAVELAEAKLASARKILNRFDRIEAVQAASEELNAAKAGK